MFSSDTQRAGFATIAIAGGIVVATALGGVFYFLRSGPVEIDTVITEDSVAIIGDGSELSIDAERVLLRSLPRGRGTDYCLLLGLDRDSCVDGAGRACQELFGACGIDLRGDVPDTQRQLAEACLVLGDSDGRDMYFAWLDGNDPNPFPLYYAIFGLSLDAFSQKGLSDAYQILLDSYFSSSSCDNRDVVRLLTEGYLVLSDSTGRDMYDAWLGSGGGNSFPLYYAVLGVRRDAFSQEGSVVAYKEILDRYSAGYYGSNAEVLRLVTEAYMVLSMPLSLSAYNGILDGDLSLVFSDTSFDFDGSDLLSALNDLDLSLSQIGSVLSSFDLSADNISTILSNLNLSTDNISTILSNLNLSADNLGTILSNLNLSADNLGTILSNLNFSADNLGTILSNLNLSADNLGTILSNLNLSTDNISTILSNLNLSADNLGTILSNLNLSADNLGTILSNLNLSTDNISTILSNLNLSADNLGTILSNLNLSADNLGTILSNLNLSADNLGTILSNLNLSADNLGTILSNLNLPAIDISALAVALNIPSFDFGDDSPGRPDSPSSFTGLIDPSDDLSLPTIAISAYPALGQIGSSSNDQPSFRLTVTKDGSAYTPDTSISVILACSQSVDEGQLTDEGQLITSLLIDTLPSFVDLSAGTTTISLGSRNPGVTGSVTCAVVPDTSTDVVYAVGSPSFDTITVVSGSSPSVLDRPPGIDLPFVSITALESSIDGGEDAIFRVSSNRELFSPLRVEYSCTATRGVADSNEGSVTIEDGSVVDISMRTNPGTSGHVHCSLLDDVSLYTVRNRTDSVAVGLLRTGDADLYDPTLPTVSLIAYQSDRGDPTSFSRRITDTIVNSTDTYFGFVIDEPAVSDSSDPFGVLKSPEGVLANDPYDLHTTSFGVTISVLHDLRIRFLDTNESTEQIISRPWSTALGFGEERVVIEKDAERVVMRKGTGETVVCGESQGRVVCSTFIGTGTVLQPIRVVVQCFRDFSESDRDREVFDALIGGRYQRSDTLQYGVEVPDYEDDADTDDPKGILYQFILPAGSYISADEQSILPLGTAPFLEADSTFSCEIVGGGVEDGYNVEAKYSRAAVQVYPRPVVSIEPEGVVGIGDADPLGAPVATISYGDRQYEFEENSPFVSETGLGNSATSDTDTSFSGVADGLLQSFGVGFLTSFGSCVGAGILNGGIRSISDIGTFGLGADVATKDKNQDNKECYLDVAASAAVTEVLTAITRDYIVWAHEGFEDKPLFVRNPTTFYKNFHDNVIGRAIDRSGLGFLCDIGVGNLDAYTANLKIKLQQRYYGIETVQPRCTYNDLSNNLDQFLGDVDRSLRSLSDSTYRDFEKLFPSLTIDGVASTQFGGTILLPSPRSDAGNQLDTLSANLERTMKQVQNSKNLLLSISELDALVDEVKHDFDAVAKPIGQIFNPNDPTSVAAFTECSAAQNPEGDPDCFILNVSGSRITDAFGKALDGPFDRLKQADESGEIGQLVKLAVNATSAGLMKRFLSDGFGVTVGRETVDILTDIVDSSHPSSFYSEQKIGLGGMWWSAFFQDNGFYEHLLGADLYETDVFTLLQYLNSSFYNDTTGSTKGFPPTTPYNDFYFVHDGYDCGDGYGHCKEGYRYLKDEPQGTLTKHLNYYLNERGKNTISDEGPSEKSRAIEDLKHELDDHGDSALEGFKRFQRAYRFLSNFDIRQQYHTFIDSLAELGGLSNDDIPTAVSLYKHSGTGKQWTKVVLNDDPDLFRESPKNKTLPQLLGGLKHGVLLSGKITATYPTSFTTTGDAIFTDAICSSSSLTPCEKEKKDEGGFECVLTNAFNGACIKDVAGAMCKHLSNEEICKKEKGVGPDNPPDTCVLADDSLRDDFSCKMRYVGGPGGSSICTPIEEKGTGNLDKNKYCNFLSDFKTIKILRDIYEATLIAHIHLVGSIDEYDGYGAQLTNSFVHAYRSAILADKEHSSALERWQLVRDETFDKFRDGTMSVYFPLENGKVGSEYTGALANCALVGDEGKENVIEVNHPTTHRAYQKAACILGTVFQDQAYFVVRRSQSGFPELLNKSLHVDLACGYAPSLVQVYDCEPNPDDGSFPTSASACNFNASHDPDGLHSYDEGCIVDNYLAKVTRAGKVVQDALTDAVFSPSPDPSRVPSTCTVTFRDELAIDERYQFANIKNNLRLYSPVEIGPNQDAVLFPVPRTPSFFGPGDDGFRSEREIRCSIVDVSYADAGGSGAVIDTDPDNLTAVVEVSRHDFTNHTFHSQVNAVMHEKSIPVAKSDRINEIGVALFYTYVIGWYYGFIEMPYYSIQGLLSNPPISFSGEVSDFANLAYRNQELLQRYRLLASLFVDESDERFSADHFGFLTPPEAHQKHRDNYNKRSDAYFGRVLGEFLQKLSPQHRQQ